MFDSSLANLTLFAQADGGSNPIMAILIMVGPILIIFWFLIIRPQQREDDRRKKMVNALKKNDRVYTVGGIIGVVHSVDLEKKEVVLKVDDSNNTKVRFLLSAVSAVLSESSSEEEKK